MNCCRPKATGGHNARASGSYWQSPSGKRGVMVPGTRAIYVRRSERRGRFKPRQSGNPAGKAEGTCNAATLTLEALLEGQAQALTQKAIGLAWIVSCRHVKIGRSRLRWSQIHRQKVLRPR
jgi:hypothetical protein